MQFSDVLGQDYLKKHLITSADNQRIPHAQLFVGKEGTGTLAMAIAYARYILCNDKSGLEPEENAPCHLKFENLSHPDLHFAFPVATNHKIKSNPVSANFLEEWRAFVKEQVYGNLFDWHRLLGIEKKQSQIGVHEAQDIVKSLSLKSYEGGYKVMIIWMADKLNIAASNKLLKLIEEPPAKTLFILIAEDEEQIIQTIRSRCQVLQFPPLPEVVITQGLLHKGAPQQLAEKIAHQSNGNFNKAIDIYFKDSEDDAFENWFVVWVRSAFKAKGNKAAIHDLLRWSEQLAASGRETQKQFLHFCLDTFRQALLLNYKAGDLVYSEFKDEGFKLEKFAPFVHGNNIVAINRELEDAIYHIERNGNAKIIFTDLSIKLTRLLHTKPN